MDDYSDHPVSLGEHRANRARDAGAWTPRDALIAALRAIDSGELKVDSLIVVAATEGENNGTTMNYFQAIPSTFYGIGMLVAAIKDYN